jgi:biopolymer transport protein ExbD
MTWKVRHEGSSRSAPVGTLDEIHQGLADGLWSPEDEVQAPGETAWTPLSAHPATEDAAAEVEPPEPAHHEDETHLDMTALIDVCLVLLIFFMLLVGYTAMHKRLAAAATGTNQQAGPTPVFKNEVEKSMIWLKIDMADGSPVFKATVTDNGKQTVKELDASNLEDSLKALVRPTRMILLLDYNPKVPHGDVTRAIDAATGLRLNIKILMPKK